jgi:hypothetical protein
VEGPLILNTELSRCGCLPVDLAYGPNMVWAGRRNVRAVRFKPTLSLHAHDRYRTRACVVDKARESICVENSLLRSIIMTRVQPIHLISSVSEYSYIKRSKFIPNITIFRVLNPTCEYKLIKIPHHNLYQNTPSQSISPPAIASFNCVHACF